MRILVVTQYFWPENFRINDLVSGLAASGHEITVLTGKPNYPAGQVFDTYKQNPENFAHFSASSVLRVPMLARGQGSFRLALNYLSFVVGACIWGPWLLRQQDFDVIFVFEPSPVTVGLPAILLGHIKQLPVVFWVLDLWPETLAAIGVVRSPRLLSWIGHLVSFIYNRCTLVLGQSRGFLASIAKYCTNPQKIRYFPSWSEDIFSDTVIEKATEVPDKEGAFNILFAGNIGEAQDLPAVLDAAEQLKDNLNIRWLIVGDGRKSDWLAAHVMQRGLEQNILLLGRFPVERMPSFYAHADTLLVSLKKDPVFSMTIPGKVQSYLMSGIPLMGMLDGEGAAVIEQAGAGLTCAAGDSAGLAAAILELARMPARDRAAMGARGRLFAQKEFGREILIGRLEGFFNEAISAQQASSGKQK